MKYSRFVFIALSVLSLTVARTGVSADFNGEVLIAPPPPNWSGGAPEITKTGLKRVWKRDFLLADGSTEQVVVTRMVKQGNAVANLSAQKLSITLSEHCVQKTISKIKSDKAKGIASADFTVQCSQLKETPAEISLFAMARVLVGDFNTYTVARIWQGNSTDPASPANSPRTGAQWAKYFARISVCNTLSEDCDPAQAEIIHADPRFKVMRAMPVSIKPVMVLKDMLVAAEGFGVLTGRAEYCGEDVTPLTSKVARMFTYVAANDRDSSKALSAFKTARIKGLKDQAKLSKESCGQVRRDFRQHPTRVSAFPRYVERFL